MSNVLNHGRHGQHGKRGSQESETFSASSALLRAFRDSNLFERSRYEESITTT